MHPTIIKADDWLVLIFTLTAMWQKRVSVQPEPVEVREAPKFVPLGD